jgi:imidazolonepropionase-like amidohydrolase
MVELSRFPGDRLMMNFCAPRRGSGALARVVLTVHLTLAAGVAFSQSSTVPTEGVAERKSRHVVLTNARIIVEPGRVIENGSIEVNDGRIIAVQEGKPSHAGIAVRDLGGKTVFAGFIDVAARVGVPDDMRAGAIKPLPPGPPPHQTTLDQAGARHWNRRVRPEWSVADRLDYKVEEAKIMRALGFASVHAVPEAGVIKGEGALLSLHDSAQERDILLAGERAQHFGFELAGGFSGEYPGSLMGAIALIRQSLYDAHWHAGRQGDDRFEPNLALQALALVSRGTRRAFFQLDDELDVQRVAALVREFDLDAVFIGTGYEYRVLAQARAAGVAFVLPVALPEAPQVENADTALNTSLAELQHWEQAAANPGRMAGAGIHIALTSRGLKEPEKKFWSDLRLAVRAGLDEAAALRALTITPASMLGESARLGRIAPGQLANLVVADAGLFREDKARIYETWVEGERYEHKPIAAANLTGTWTLVWTDGRGPKAIAFEGEGDTLDAAVDAVKFKAKFDGERVTALPPATLFGLGEGSSRISAIVRGDAIEGYRDLTDGRRIRFSGQRRSPASSAVSKTASAELASETIPAYRGYPAGEYGRAAVPTQPDTVFVRDATVWTNGNEGVIEHADVLVKRGKIADVGVDLTPPADAIVIEAAGLHLTPGIVDAHSHTAVARNVNEPSHAVTTEVRVADALDPTDIDLYRQLAGGVTAANLLHGSANPMGGQNAVIKLRWGADARGLLLAGAKPGVKFALGENVKQSGWGDAFVTRYPQTRMGVEQVMRDHFNAARDYAAKRAGKNGNRERRNLRLDALAEILAGERLIHVHSYRQDEILMFARMAKDYSLPVSTFQHVLEGYKVADAIADIGAGGSTFADWWGYKMEVMDGIPHNGALMTRAGVVTSFNSDSNEMARRLNMEAAKAMRYGGLDEQEALKLVTLNPAMQLRIDDRVGALRPGLDADFVLWSEHPLSNYARAEQTWIDGRKYFDRREDAAGQVAMATERERLIQKALKDRGKTLSLIEDKAKDKGKDDDAESGDPDPALLEEALRNANWLIEHAAGRSLYHSGADLMSCGQHDHAH